MAERLTFRWGVADCATAAAAHVFALTGRDVFAPYAGAYDSPVAAGRLIAAHGGLIDMVDAALDGIWPRGGREIAALGKGPRACLLAVRDGPWWRMPCADGSVLRTRITATPALASWGPANG